LTHNRLSIGQKLFWPVVSLFVLFVILFVAFQQTREKEYKAETLSLRLQDYNNLLAEELDTTQRNSGISNTVKDKIGGASLRITIIDEHGKVVYDNVRKDYGKMGNHSSRKEFREALAYGTGTDISRPSQSTGDRYFYCANYYPEKRLVIRTALPYDDTLASRLAADQHYIWFALVITVMLIAVLYRFIHRMSINIENLRLFASQAESKGELNMDNLAEFSDDELGEISEHIIKLFMKLERTREEQTVLKRQLTQNVAHELKTPVASIQGYLETILSNPDMSEEVKETFLSRCYAQSKRLTNLLQDISTLNRLDDAPDVKDFQPVDISALVKTIGREVALHLQDRDMTFDNRLPEGIVVQGNQSLLYSIFRNLTDNAIAYAGDNTTITVDYDPKNSQFTFMDNGVGVSAQHLSRLFERFYRADKGRSRKQGGTGLGLAIVKNAVLLHGGSIGVKLNDPHGLRFDFTLH